MSNAAGPSSGKILHFRWSSDWLNSKIGNDKKHAILQSLGWKFILISFSIEKYWVSSLCKGYLCMFNSYDSFCCTTKGNKLEYWDQTFLGNVKTWSRCNSFGWTKSAFGVDHSTYRLPSYTSIIFIKLIIDKIRKRKTSKYNINIRK